MHNRVLVVNLKFAYGDKKWDEYNQASAAAKWVRIKKRIHECYEACKALLKDNFHHTKIIFCMHEYAIYDEGWQSMAVRPLMKRHIMQEMLKFSAEHPNVAIYLPFAVRHTRRIAQLSRTERQQDANLSIDWWEKSRVQDDLLKTHPDLVKLKKENKLAEFKKLEAHLKLEELKKLKFDFKGLSKNHKKTCQFEHHRRIVKKLRKNQTSPFFDEITNSVHIFERGTYRRYNKQVSFHEAADNGTKEELLKQAKSPMFSVQARSKQAEKKNHGRISPLKLIVKSEPLLDAKLVSPKDQKDEIVKVEIGNKDYYPTVFSPGREDRSVLVHTCPNGMKFTAGVEICRDHRFGTLKNYLKKRKMQVDLQFVFSDSISTFDTNICAKYFIHVDSQEDSKFRVMGDSSDVVMYENNLLENNSDLVEIKPEFVKPHDAKATPTEQTSVSAPTTAEKKAKTLDELTIDIIDLAKQPKTSFFSSFFNLMKDTFYAKPKATQKPIFDFAKLPKLDLGEDDLKLGLDDMEQSEKSVDIEEDDQQTLFENLVDLTKPKQTVISSDTLFRRKPKDNAAAKPGANQRKPPIRMCRTP